MLGVLTRLGYVNDYSDQIAAAANLLERMAADLGPSGDVQNVARRLATRCLGRVVAVYGGELMAEVARRWKGQINENGKTWAFFDQLPELNHNAVLGFRFPEAAGRELLVFMLSAAGNHPRIRLRERVTTELLESNGIEVERVEAQGRDKFEQVYSALYLGDFVSYYLALANGVDPSDNAAIDQLKARLARGA
jgi:glucose/mannose-6-phosphate isomerase